MLNETFSWNAFAAYPALDFSAGLKLFTLHFSVGLHEIILMHPQVGH